jgi:hypothetical protein
MNSGNRPRTWQRYLGTIGALVIFFSWLVTNTAADKLNTQQTALADAVGRQTVVDLVADVNRRVSRVEAILLSMTRDIHRKMAPRASREPTDSLGLLDAEALDMSQRFVLDIDRDIALARVLAALDEVLRPGEQPVRIFDRATELLTTMELQHRSATDQLLNYQLVLMRDSTGAGLSPSQFASARTELLQLFSFSNNRTELVKTDQQVRLLGQQLFAEARSSIARLRHWDVIAGRLSMGLYVLGTALVLIGAWLETRTGIR